MQTPGRQEAAAPRLTVVGDHTGRSRRERDHGVLATADPDALGIGDDGHGGVLLDRRVQLLAQPGREALDRGGDHLRCYRR
ncbi:hypothetical protein ACQP2T_27510 [Nonomuraea sp. CA-143628]|uniref:hypothetical protein n=1 Tax=Nonomuraea sp. CA-143628 TaxID=3239997 RepID=UPI003D8C5B2F